MRERTSQRQIRPVSRPRLYEQVARQILTWMSENEITVGDRLPPERELATNLGVSRATVSQALVAMEVVGVIAVRHGDGAIVVSTDAAQHMVDDIRAHTKRLPDVLDARDALETKLAALAAARRSADDLTEIDEALAAMAADIAAGGRGVEGDERFHAAITKAAHSPVLARMMTELAPMILETRIESLGQPKRPQESLAQHRAVARAVSDQDAEAAAAAMHQHVSTVSDLAILREG